MLRFDFRVIVVFALASCSIPAQAFGRAGTMIVATEGQPTDVPATWPQGVGELVNDATRTTGWNSFFSEWPNDVRQYAFKIATMDDVNRLIEKLASVEAETRQIRLSFLKEPKGLGWVTQLPEGNDIAVIFSIGDQAQIDEWYKHVRKPFGQMEFLAAPVAVPPTLTIFVQNEAVDLEAMRVPNGVTVTGGYVPTVFHRSNTTLEKKAEEEAARKPKAGAVPANLNPAEQAAADKITEFLRKHGDAARRE